MITVEEGPFQGRVASGSVSNAALEAQLYTVAPLSVLA